MTYVGLVQQAPAEASRVLAVPLRQGYQHRRGLLRVVQGLRLPTGLDEEVPAQRRPLARMHDSQKSLDYMWLGDGTSPATHQLTPRTGPQHWSQVPDDILSAFSIDARMSSTFNTTGPVCAVWPCTSVLTSQNTRARVASIRNHIVTTIANGGGGTGIKF
jgi:hypothetical protein